MTIQEESQKAGREKIKEWLTDVTIHSLYKEKQTAKCGGTQIATGKERIVIEIEDPKVSDNFIVDYIQTISRHYTLDPNHKTKP